MKERNVELEYQRVTKADLPIMIALYDEYLNGGDSSTEHLRKAIAEDGYIGVKCVDKAQGDRFVGVFSCLPGICFTYDHPELEAFVESRWGGTKLNSGDILVVLPEYRGYGVARELTKQLRVALIQEGVQNLLVEMWNPLNLGDLPAGGIMKYLGEFSWIEDMPDFYKDLYAHGMTCPDCGDGPCRCGATVGMIPLVDR